MLAAGNMLEALSNDEESKVHKNHNDDHDFGDVLEFCSGETEHKNKLRYPDGKEEFFSFDN